MHVMSEETRLLQNLSKTHRTLLSNLQICRACGHLSMTETEQLRDTLFALSARFREACQGENGDVSALQRHQIAQLLSSAALCLMNGPHDCPQWRSVDAEKLASCVDELGRVLHSLKHTRTA